MNTELDAEVAEKVMGWTWYPVQYNTDQRVLVKHEADAYALLPGDSIYRFVPPYSTDIAAAWKVEAAIPENMQGHYIHHLREAVEVDPHRHYTIFDLVHATPEQRCRAALAAVRKENNDGR